MAAYAKLHWRRELCFATRFPCSSVRPTWTYRKTQNTQEGRVSQRSRCIYAVNTVHIYDMIERCFSAKFRTSHRWVARTQKREWRIHLPELSPCHAAERTEGERQEGRSRSVFRRRRSGQAAFAECIPRKVRAAPVRSLMVSGAV